MITTTAWKLRDWRCLHGKGASHIRSIVASWNALLNCENTTEQLCTKFLRENAGLFLAKPPDTPIVLSEVFLGSDYKIDFVRATEGFSAGTAYELIEFECPNSPMYNQNGKTSARLSNAIDQVLEWRRWITEHRSQARKIFPSKRWDCGVEPTFTYTIVIGRRTESQQVQNKIWSRMHAGNIQIVSYDRITSWMESRIFFDNFICSLAAQTQRFQDNKALLNQAACPYTRSMSQAEWKNLNPIARSQFSDHLIDAFLSTVDHLSLVNHKRLQEFDLFNEQTFSPTVDNNTSP